MFALRSSCGSRALSATVTPIPALSIAISACCTEGAFASAVSIDLRRSATNGASLGASAGTTSTSPPTGSSGSLMIAFSRLPASESDRRASITSALRASTVATAFAYCANVASNSRRFAKTSRTSSPTVTSHSALTSRARALTSAQYACSARATTDSNSPRIASCASRSRFSANRTSARATSEPNPRKSGCERPRVTALCHAGSGTKRLLPRLSIRDDAADSETRPPESSVRPIPASNDQLRWLVTFGMTVVVLPGKSTPIPGWSTRSNPAPAPRTQSNAASARVTSAAVIACSRRAVSAFRLFRTAESTAARNESTTRCGVSPVNGTVPATVFPSAADCGPVASSSSRRGASMRSTSVSTGPIERAEPGATCANCRSLLARRMGSAASESRSSAEDASGD